MTNEEIKKLKARLWQTADQLRAGSGLKSTQYSAPILGLIFLRFADSKYSKYENEINEEYIKFKGTRSEKEIHEIATIKCGFYLPDNARFDKILNLPEEENLALKIKEAMIEIEKYSPDLEGVLPKDEYYTINSSEDKTLLKKLLKNFKDIPDDISIDIFGEIYEYFLGEFALSEGQGGGEFFTPSTVVRYMVEVLAPTEGKILDPACGSGGMFVQTAHYIANHKYKHGENSEINLRAYGVEKTSETVKLAKMNLALNNIRGEIIEANSYYSDPHNSYGAFDYVMANPPFNVDEVELDLVKSQKRFNEYGVPQNKTKSSKKNRDKTEKVPNANYLWINQFATALKPNGRAALVMANSASDSGNSEKDVRIKLIESGIISQMVTLPTNMFNTVTLPATLWFFNKSKPKEDEILFIDARNIFTVVDRSHRKFSDEQIKNLSIISRLYEGKSDEFYELLDEYNKKMDCSKDKQYWQENINWLIERFPDGKYRDIVGLCKVASIEGEDGIKDQNYSLNPGRYVGVLIEDDGLTEEEFKQELKALNDELNQLNTNALELEKRIAIHLSLLVSGDE
ncbi:class I SAM-dependent DNA methyltransferase [Neobacillus vireti]|uniref:class I SAM-dependent DNA methyltransferase n=1 Tax=Neobacillus vireti TaxID=220686 RepID=UPI002FFE872C